MYAFDSISTVYIYAESQRALRTYRNASYVSCCALLWVNVAATAAAVTCVFVLSYNKSNNNEPDVSITFFLSVSLSPPQFGGWCTQQKHIASVWLFAKGKTYQNVNVTHCDCLLLWLNGTMSTMDYAIQSAHWLNCHLLTENVSIKQILRLIFNQWEPIWANVWQMQVTHHRVIIITLRYCELG